MHLCFCSEASHVTVNQRIARKNAHLIVKLLLVVIGMVGFSFALIPLYDVLCAMTGINGKVGAPVDAELLKFTVDERREIGVDFITSLGKSTPLLFQVETKKLQVHPGKFYEINYIAQNISDTAVVARAVPSVAPGLAAADFKIVACYCFAPQRFEAGESKQLQLRFAVDPKLPQESKNIALAITFLNTNKD